MGEDKAFLTLTPDGPPVIVRTIEIAQRLSDDVFVVAPDRPGYRLLDVPIVPDREPGLGPLGGISTALAVARHAFCVVVSCDLPFLRFELLSWMAGLPRAYEVLLPTIPSANGEAEIALPQPLHAIYARDCLPTIHGQIAAGDLRLSNLTARLKVQSLDAQVLRTIDPGLDSFFNLNTPDDARRAVKLAAAHPKNG